jgi:signal transduction histidine kinase
LSIAVRRTIIENVFTTLYFLYSIVMSSPESGTGSLARRRILVVMLFALSAAALALNALLALAGGTDAARWLQPGNYAVALILVVQLAVCCILLADYLRGPGGGEDGEGGGLPRYLMTAREIELARIARELHDELGSNLTAVAMDLAWARKHLQDQQPVAARLERAHSVLSSTVDAKRRIIDELRPTILDNLGLSAAIESHAMAFSVRTGLHLDLQLAEDVPELPPGAPIALFRIFQEALTNAANHAGEAHLRVALRVEGGVLVLEIIDDGVGVPAPKSGTAATFGLVEMRERARQIGASIVVGSGADGRGTVVRANLKLPVVPRK